MPSLEVLRGKWFLNFRRPDLYPAFPPIGRHRGSHVADYTDGNAVVLQIDGQLYMESWYDYIEEIWNRQAGRIYHANLKMDGVHPLGHNSGPSGRECLSTAAGRQGVGVHALLCRNWPSVLTNAGTLLWFLTHGVPHACLDQRYPARGSNHQKFTCFVNPDPNRSKALVGSIDINVSRWDTQEHLQHDDLPPRGGRVPGETPTHDLGLMVMGPAMADLEWTFIERWNDPSRTWGMRRSLPHPHSEPAALPQIVTPARQRRPAGTQSVQVLHSYGRALPRNTSYSWCNDRGEYSIWASYLNAIKRAQHFIYIEDQYFVPFNWPPWYRSSRPALREIDLIYQLGQRIRNGVKVVVVVPRATGQEDAMVGVNFDYQRSVGAHYLETIAQRQRQAGGRGDFVIGYLRNGSNRAHPAVNIYVHSKVMICDDEFVLCGSANVNRRSMTHDSELQLGIVDAQTPFVRDFRRYLWSEHLRIPIQGIPADFNSGLVRFRQGGGILVIYTPRAPDPAPQNHRHRFNQVADPYAGPPLDSLPD